MLKDDKITIHDLPQKIKAYLIVLATVFLVTGFILGKWYQSYQLNSSQNTTAKIVSGAKNTDIVSGTVKTVNSTQIILVDLQGRTKEFAINEKTNIIRDSNKISSEDIKTNDKARIIPDYSDTGKARQILIVLDQPSP